MSGFLLLKLIHISCVISTFILFNLRVFWKLYQPDQLQQTWVKRTPHLVDSILLLSAITMAFIIGQCPFVNAPWLTVKTLALLLYITLGIYLFRHTQTPLQTITGWLLAQLTFFYIVLVAIFQQPWPRFV